LLGLYTLDNTLELEEYKEIKRDTPLFLEEEVAESYSEKRYIEESPIELESARRVATVVRPRYKDAYSKPSRVYSPKPSSYKKAAPNQRILLIGILCTKNRA
jgi:hypothetical protein